MSQATTTIRTPDADDVFAETWRGSTRREAIAEAFEIARFRRADGDRVTVARAAGVLEINVWDGGDLAVFVRVAW